MKASFIAIICAFALGAAVPSAALAQRAPRARARVAARPFVARPYVVRPYFYGRFGYDPFWYGPGWGYGYRYPYIDNSGGLRLEVTPKTAQVFVDGYYAGVVDDFDGHFQHLDLAPGGHRIEVRQPGFQPLTFNTYAQPGHTTDYKAALVPAPGA